jgi:hypothetical protein
VAHGAWNALVATSFAGLVSGVSTPATHRQRRAPR